MSSDKRDLSNLLDYEGDINKKENIYEFPQLYKLSKLKKIRVWKIVVRLVKNPKKPNKKVNWNLLKDEQLPIRTSYITGNKKLPPYSTAQYWVVTGEIDGEKTIHPPTYGELKNKGRANERNALQTAIIGARNEYLKKTKGGFKTNIKDVTSERINTSSRYFPMLPVKYKERYEKIDYPCYVQPKLDGTRVLAFLNKNNDSTNKSVILYTRELKDVPGKKPIRKQLKPILKELYNQNEKESIYIDFEFYKFGKKLQDISSELRNENTELDNEESAQCWIFDAFYPSDLSDIGFDERLTWIDDIFEINEKTNKEINPKKLKFRFDKDAIVENYSKWLNQLKKEFKRATMLAELDPSKSDGKDIKKIFKKEKGVPSINFAEILLEKLNNLNPSINKDLEGFVITINNKLVKVPTLLARNRTEEEFLYRGMLTLGFEGSIVRNMDGLYKADSNTKSSYLRSMDVQKRKPLFTEEYPIDGFTEGKRGREKGALIWVLIRHKSTDKKQPRWNEDKLFNATPKNVTINERKELFNKFKKNKTLFEKKYKGSLIMIEFEDLSKDGIPQRLKALGLRPYK